MAVRNPVSFFFSLLTMLAVNAAADSICPRKPVKADYENLPLSFEPNRGQTSKQVLFLAHGAGYNLFLSHAEAVLTFQHAAGTVGMKPVGANTSAPPEALDQLSAKTNYFIGSIAGKWHTDIPNYAKVRYRNVYPGVDLIYYGNQRQLEYDFVVNPGGDPRRILLDFKGATKTELNRQGDVVIDTAAGIMRWHE